MHSCPRPLGHQPFIKTTALFKGFSLCLNLTLEHIQRPTNNKKHGIGHLHGTLGIQPARIFFPLLQGMLCRFVNHIVPKGRLIQQDGIMKLIIGYSPNPRKPRSSPSMSNIQYQPTTHNPQHTTPAQPARRQQTALCLLTIDICPLSSVPASIY